MSRSLRYLVYFTVGLEEEWCALVDFCTNTLRSWPENDVVDVLVLADEGMHFAHADHCIHYPRANTATVASRRKCQIFDFKRICDYDAVLYLDCDIVIEGSLLPILESVAADPNYLHVYHEKIGKEFHAESFFNLPGAYTLEDMQMLEADNMHVFNCGHFAFVPTEEMRYHFDQVLQLVQLHPDAFYEQSHMNVYFNRRRLQRNTLQQFVGMPTALDFVPQPGMVVMHCASIFMSSRAEEKLEYMRAEWRRSGLKAESIVIDSRDRFHEVLTMPSQWPPQIVEVGTFLGAYASYLLEAFQPVRLLLVDPWEGELVSGDADGNNMTYVSGEEAFMRVRLKFGNDERVCLLRGTIADLTPGDTNFDLAYIDGDHSTEGVSRDLEAMYRRVRPRGWIAGHDIDINPSKTDYVYDVYFGVKEAVTSFCAQRGLRVWVLAMDGCVSWAIRR